MDCYICYNERVQIRYIGKAFRERHGVGLRALARGTGLSTHTIRALEANTAQPNVATVAKIATYFEQQGITVRDEDLLRWESNTPPTDS